MAARLVAVLQLEKGKIWRMDTLRQSPEIHNRWLCWWPIQLCQLWCRSVQSAGVFCANGWNRTNFYRASYALRSICFGRVSVCLSVCVCLCVSVSVTSRSCTKMAKHRKTQTRPHDSPGTIVFWGQKSFRNSDGVTLNGSAKCRWDRSKLANFKIQHKVDE